MSDDGTFKPPEGTLHFQGPQAWWRHPAPTTGPVLRLAHDPMPVVTYEELAEADHIFANHLFDHNDNDHHELGQKLAHTVRQLLDERRWMGERYGTAFEELERDKQTLQAQQVALDAAMDDLRWRLAKERDALVASPLPESVERIRSDPYDAFRTDRDSAMEWLRSPQFDAMIDALRWIPFSEQQPAPHVQVLVTVANTMGGDMVTYTTVTRLQDWGPVDRHPFITHWRPLPPSAKVDRADLPEPKPPPPPRRAGSIGFYGALPQPVPPPAATVDPETGDFIIRASDNAGYINLNTIDTSDRVALGELAPQGEAPPWRMPDGVAALVNLGIMLGAPEPSPAPCNCVQQHVPVFGGAATSRGSHHASSCPMRHEAR